MVGIGRVVMARRERGTTLHYPYEIRSEESVFEENPEMKLPDRQGSLCVLLRGVAGNGMESAPAADGACPTVSKNSNL
jgi:hypothetical protein